MLFEINFIFTIFFFKKTEHLFSSLETPTVESDALYTITYYIYIR